MGDILEGDYLRAPQLRGHYSVQLQHRELVCNNESNASYIETTGYFCNFWFHGPASQHFDTQ